MAVSILPAERDVLARHPVERDRRIPCFVGISRVRREIWRARNGIGTIDRRKQCKIAARIIHDTATQRETVQILLEPKTVVDHPSGEGLLTAGRRIVVAVHVVVNRSALCADKIPAAAVFAAEISGKGECHLV